MRNMSPIRHPQLCSIAKAQRFATEHSEKGTPLACKGLWVHSIWLKNVSWADTATGGKTGLHDHNYCHVQNETPIQPAEVCKLSTNPYDHTRLGTQGGKLTARLFGASEEPIEISSSMQWKIIFAANILPGKEGLNLKGLLNCKSDSRKAPQTQKMGDELDIAEHLPYT